MQLMNFFRSKLFRSIILIVASLLIGACVKSSNPSNAQGNVSAVGCEGNVFLQKYGCSIDRVSRGAENGDPDAQYALGYMYYYGIGSIRDKRTAKLWIDKAAAQGQPLAKRAQRLLAQGRHLHEIHSAPGGGVSRRAKRGGGAKYEPPVNVKALNRAVPSKPLQHHLPAYGKRAKKRSPVVDDKSSYSSTVASGGSEAPKAAPKSDTDDADQREKDASQPFSALENSHNAIVIDPRLMQASKPVTARVLKFSSSEQALMRVEPAYYTLQLMGSHDLRGIKAFVKRHRLQGRVEIYSAQYHHKKWYMLVYGQYPTLKQGHKASLRLPKSLRKLHPWVKSFKLVQEEIRLGEIIS